MESRNYSRVTIVVPWNPKREDGPEEWSWDEMLNTACKVESIEALDASIGESLVWPEGRPESRPFAFVDDQATPVDRQAAPVDDQDEPEVRAEEDPMWAEMRAEIGGDDVQEAEVEAGSVPALD